MYYLQTDISYLIGCFSFTYLPRYSSKLFEQSKLSSNSLEMTVRLSISFPLYVCQILYPYYISSSILTDQSIDEFFMPYVTCTILLHTSDLFLLYIPSNSKFIIDPSYKEMYTFRPITFTSKISLDSLDKTLNTIYHLSTSTLTISIKVQKQIIINWHPYSFVESLIVGNPQRICSDLNISKCGSLSLLSQQLFQKYEILDHRVDTYNAGSA